MGFKVKFENPSQTLTLKSQLGTGQKISTLTDVDTTISSANGSVLVYNNVTEKFERRDILTFDADSGAFKLSGGSF